MEDPGPDPQKDGGGAESQQEAESQLEGDGAKNQQGGGESQQEANRNIEALDQLEENRHSTYCIRYENNNSPQWDGKEIILDAVQLEKYPACELVPGKRVVVQYLSKKGKVEDWNAVIVEREGSSKFLAHRGCTTRILNLQQKLKNNT